MLQFRWRINHVGQVHAYMLKALYEGLDINNRLFVSIKFVSSYDVRHNSFSIAKNALFFCAWVNIARKEWGVSYVRRFQYFTSSIIFVLDLWIRWLYWMADSKFVAKKGKKEMGVFNLPNFTLLQLIIHVLHCCGTSAVFLFPFFSSSYIVSTIPHLHLYACKTSKTITKIVIHNLSGSGTPSHFRIDFSLAILKIELVNNENQQNL